MSLVRETDSEVIAQFAVPVRGTWKSSAIHTIPQDALYDSLNVFIREGKLRNRPGLTPLDDTIFTNKIIGGAMAVTPTEKVILALTRNLIYQYSDITQSWSTLTPPAMQSIAPSDNSVVDIAFLETTGTYVAIIAEQSNTLKAWTALPRSVDTIVGTNIPRAKSICIASSRVIALIPPHTIVWSNVLNHTIFDPLAYAKRAQSGDNGICVRSLSSLSFALYKERSIHTARAQAGLDEGTAFSFSEPIYAEGPAGIYAVVNVGGSHIYMTKNGRIGLFNGTNYPQWIADGLWLYLQDDIEPSRAHHIRGVYDYRLHTVLFFYPRRSDRSNLGLKGMVLINLPFEGMDIAEQPTMRCFLGECEKPISHACEKRFDTSVDRSLIFSEASSTVNDAQAFLLDEMTDTDGALPYTCMFQSGLSPMPDATHIHVTVESFFERSFGNGAVLIEPVVSDSLETKAGTIPDLSGQHIDLETNPVREYLGFGMKVRFFGVKYTWRSDNTVRWSGAVVYSGTSPKVRR